MPGMGERCATERVERVGTLNRERTSRYIFQAEGMLFPRSLSVAFGAISMHVFPLVRGAMCTGKCVRKATEVLHA